MTIMAVIVISVLSTLATIALFLFAVKRFLQHRLHQRRHTFPGETHRSHDIRSQFRWRGHAQSSVKHSLKWVESILQLNAEQLTLWNPLKQSIIDSQQDLAVYSEILADAGNLKQSVNRWEDYIHESLVKLRKLKPKIIEFYQSLSVQQQQKVDKWLAGKSVGNRHCTIHCRTI